MAGDGIGLYELWGPLESGEYETLNLEVPLEASAWVWSSACLP